MPTSTYVGRLGDAPEEGVKAPVVVATNGAITLSGTQTINTVAVTAGERVLVRNQADASENGIYTCKAGAWTRTKDWNAANDVLPGILVVDAHDGSIFQADFTQPYAADTSEVTFSLIEKVTGELIIVDTFDDLRSQDPALSEWVQIRGHTTVGDGGGGPFFWNASSTDADDNGAYAKYTLLATGRWERSGPAGGYNIVMWGARVNDTGFDSLPALDAGFAYLGRGELKVPNYSGADEAKYYFSGTIVCPEGCVLRGEGSAITKLFAKDDFVGTETYVGSGITCFSRVGEIGPTAVNFTKIKNLHFSCNGKTGVIAGYSYNANEGSGYEDSRLIAWEAPSLRFIREGGGSLKNFDLTRVECYNYADNSVADYAVVEVGNTWWRSITSITMIGDGFQSTDRCKRGISFATQSTGHVSGLHFEGVVDAIYLLNCSGLSIASATGPSTVGRLDNLVRVPTGATATDITLTALDRGAGGLTVVQDDISGITIDAVEHLALYTIGTADVNKRARLHTDNVNTNILPRFRVSREMQITRKVILPGSGGYTVDGDNMYYESRNDTLTATLPDPDTLMDTEADQVTIDEDHALVFKFLHTGTGVLTLQTDQDGLVEPDGTANAGPGATFVCTSNRMYTGYAQSFGTGVYRWYISGDTDT